MNARTCQTGDFEHVVCLQGMQQLQLSQVACSSPNWRLSSITANGSPAEAGPSGRRLPGSSASSPAPCSALAQHVQVPAGAHVAAFFHLYPITRSGATVTSGVTGSRCRLMQKCLQHVAGADIGLIHSSQALPC